jgi:hypothetical protein
MCSLREQPLTDTMPLMYLDSSVMTERDVQQLAALVGLPISPADLPAVTVALGVLLEVARLVTDFPLPDDVEPAPVFRP